MENINVRGDAFCYAGPVSGRGGSRKTPHGFSGASPPCCADSAVPGTSRDDSNCYADHRSGRMDKKLLAAASFVLKKFNKKKKPFAGATPEQSSAISAISRDDSNCYADHRSGRMNKKLLAAAVSARNRDGSNRYAGHRPRGRNIKLLAAAALVSQVLALTACPQPTQVVITPEPKPPCTCFDDFLAAKAKVTEYSNDVCEPNFCNEDTKAFDAFCAGLLFERDVKRAWQSKPESDKKTHTLQEVGDKYKVISPINVNGEYVYPHFEKTDFDDVNVLEARAKEFTNRIHSELNPEVDGPCDWNVDGNPPCQEDGSITYQRFSNYRANYWDECWVHNGDTGRQFHNFKTWSAFRSSIHGLNWPYTLDGDKVVPEPNNGTTWGQRGGYNHYVSQSAGVSPFCIKVNNSPLYGYPCVNKHDIRNATIKCFPEMNRAHEDKPSVKPIDTNYHIRNFISKLAPEEQSIIGGDIMAEYELLSD